MAEHMTWDYGTNNSYNTDQMLKVDYRPPRIESGKIVHGSECEIIELTENRESYGERTGVILQCYAGKLSVSADGKYDLGKHFIFQKDQSRFGFFGRVDVCIDKALKGRSEGVFVMKFIDLRKLKSVKEKVNKSVLREVRALLRCKHENIVKLIGLIVEPSCVYILMDHGGDPLHNKITGIVPSTDVVLKWSGQILSGISCMHENGYVHCDLHLGNFLIDGKNNLRICDLGSAKYIGEPLFTISHGYTTWYFPPTVLKRYMQRKQKRQIKGNSLEEQEKNLEELQIYVKQRLDLYATGKLLLEIVSDRGNKPIKLEELKDAIQSKEKWNLFLKGTIPPGCNAMIKYLITNLMTYNTNEELETTKLITAIEEGLKMQKKMKKCDHTMASVVPLPQTLPQSPVESLPQHLPLSQALSQAPERNRRTSEEEPMDTNQ